MPVFEIDAGLLFVGNTVQVRRNSVTGEVSAHHSVQFGKKRAYLLADLIAQIVTEVVFRPARQKILGSRSVLQLVSIGPGENADDGELDGQHGDPVHWHVRRFGQCFGGAMGPSASTVKRSKWGPAESASIDIKLNAMVESSSAVSTAWAPLRVMSLSCTDVGRAPFC